MPRPRKLLKFLGDVAWSPVGEESSGTIRRAILRNGEELVIGLASATGPYSLTLHRREGDDYEGTWSYRDGQQARSDSVTATLYRAANDRVLLFGEWREDGEVYHWWAHFHAVESFPDERH